MSANATLESAAGHPLDTDQCSRDFLDMPGFDRLTVIPVEGGDLGLGSDVIGLELGYEYLNFTAATILPEIRDTAVYRNQSAKDAGTKPFRTAALMLVELDFSAATSSEAEFHQSESGLYFIGSGNNSPVSEQATREFEILIRENGLDPLEITDQTGVLTLSERWACAENNLVQCIQALMKGEGTGEYEGVKARLPENLTPTLYLAGQSLANSNNVVGGEGQPAQKPIVGNRHIILPDGTDVLYPCGDPCRANVLDVFGGQLLVVCFVLEEGAQAVPIHALTTTISGFDRYNERTAAGDLYRHGRGSLEVLAQGPEGLRSLPGIQVEYSNSYSK